MFHVVTAGGCWVEILDASVPPLRLTAGDIVVVPMGDPRLCSTLGLRSAEPRPILPADRHQLPFFSGRVGARGPSRFVCGYLGCDARPFNPVLQGLPRLLHARAADGAEVHDQLIRLAVDETAARRSGGETSTLKVAELMFVDVVRRHIDTLPPGSSGWLSGCATITSARRWRSCMGDPRRRGRVERLAREVGLSRSAFAERFAHFVQESPMQYLTRWRMQLATRLLERQGVGVAQVAAEVGYESEAAFNRAFKKCVGAPPGAWRRGRQISARVGAA
jgi:AraC-like DNA-binding protein